MINIITAVLRNAVNSCCTSHRIPLKFVGVRRWSPGCSPATAVAPGWQGLATQDYIPRNRSVSLRWPPCFAPGGQFRCLTKWPPIAPESGNGELRVSSLVETHLFLLLGSVSWRFVNLHFIFLVSCLYSPAGLQLVASPRAVAVLARALAKVSTREDFRLSACSETSREAAQSCDWSSLEQRLNATQARQERGSWSVWSGVLCTVLPRPELSEEQSWGCKRGPVSTRQVAHVWAL